LFRGLSAQETRLDTIDDLRNTLAVGETVSFAQIKEEELFDARDTKPSSWWLLALIVGALFAFKFAILMVDGAVFGRIAMPPVYDDISYFVDACFG
jgi:hypothetical protein